MSRFFFTILGLMSMFTATSQIHEIGVFGGASNFVGDVGAMNYVKPNETAFGLIYKWNRNKRYSWRLTYIQSKITGQDSESSDNKRLQRDFRFENNIKEVGFGFEFNFYEFNLFDSEQQVTPYVVTGANYLHYDGLFFVGNKTKSNSSHGTIAVPMIVGVKTNLNSQWIAGFEVGARYTFADDLDGSYPTNKNLKPLRFGNINSKDWYVFSGFTLTYTFGNKPCFCTD